MKTGRRSHIEFRTERKKHEPNGDKKESTKRRFLLRHRPWSTMEH